MKTTLQLLSLLLWCGYSGSSVTLDPQDLRAIIEAASNYDGSQIMQVPKDPQDKPKIITLYNMSGEKPFEFNLQEFLGKQETEALEDAILHSENKIVDSIEEYIKRKIEYTIAERLDLIHPSYILLFMQGGFLQEVYQQNGIRRNYLIKSTQINNEQIHLAKDNITLAKYPKPHHKISVGMGCLLYIFSVIMDKVYPLINDEMSLNTSNPQGYLLNLSYLFELARISDAEDLYIQIRWTSGREYINVNTRNFQLFEELWEFGKSHDECDRENFINLLKEMGILDQDSNIIDRSNAWISSGCE